MASLRTSARLAFWKSFAITSTGETSSPSWSCSRTWLMFSHRLISKTWWRHWTITKIGWKLSRRAKMQEKTCWRMYSGYSITLMIFHSNTGKVWSLDCQACTQRTKDFESYSATQRILRRLYHSSGSKDRDLRHRMSKWSTLLKKRNILILYQKTLRK